MKNSDILALATAGVEMLMIILRNIEQGKLVLETSEKGALDALLAQVHEASLSASARLDAAAQKVIDGAAAGAA